MKYSALAVKNHLKLFLNDRKVDHAKKIGAGKMTKRESEYSLALLSAAIKHFESLDDGLMIEINEEKN